MCVVDVSDPSNPTVKEGLVDSTYMNGAYGIAWDPAAKLLFVAGRDSDSLAVMSVAGTAAKYIAPTSLPSPNPTNLPSPPPSLSLAPTPSPTSWTYGK